MHSNSLFLPLLFNEVIGELPSCFMNLLFEIFLCLYFIVTRRFMLRSQDELNSTSVIWRLCYLAAVTTNPCQFSCNSVMIMGLLRFLT